MKIKNVRYYVFILIAMILTTIAGVAFGVSLLDGNDVEAAEINENHFVKVHRYYYTDIVYDTETNVMYAVSAGSDNRGSFCLLVNPDGTPKLYKE